MIEKVKESRKKALIRQQWQVGDLAIRLGHPYTYPDNDAKPLILDCDTFQGINHYLGAYYIVKDTPKYIIEKNSKKNFKKLKELFKKVHRDLLPYKKLNQIYVDGQASIRSQDISFIRKYSSLKKNITHLDLGPGLGDMCPTIKLEYNTKYIALESTPLTYSVQREFLKYLYYSNQSIYDVVEAEDFKSEKEIESDINKKEFDIIHLPSWHFKILKNNSVDLVAATFMLNELSYSGLFWLISNAVNKLKKNGYLYIRDSYILKPGMHQIEYDKLLTKIGFKEIAFYRIKNRFDFYGIPRLYKKINNNKISFEKLAKMFIGRFGVVASGQQRAYNLKNSLNK